MAQNIIVIGAGIIGASAAYHLQKSGAQVTVLDAGAAAATDASFGWINASFFLDAEHFRLRVEGIKAYRALGRELDLPVSWSGCLCFETSGAAFDEQAQGLSDLGYPFEEIDAKAFSALVPQVANPPARCLKFEQEGAAESGALAVHLLTAATNLGARLIRGVAAIGFETKGGAVVGVRTTAGILSADQVISAVGTASEALMAQVDIKLPLLQRPAVMMKTRPVPFALNHILVSDLGELRQLPDGGLMMPAAIGHQSDSSETIGATIDVEADQALARLQAMLPDFPLDWEQVQLAHRPMPADGLPVVGAATDGLYVACMHSGITLGALMGAQIAIEVRKGPTNETTQRLAPYRPARFAK